MDRLNVHPRSRKVSVIRPRGYVSDIRRPIAGGVNGFASKPVKLWRPRLVCEAGFATIEVMVAAVVLLVGMLGVVAMLTGAMSATARSNDLVGATNLARELVETTRGLDYDNLTPAALVSSVQARGVGTGTPWTVVRRGTTYTVTATTCTFDSPADRYSATSPSNVCPSQPTEPTGDPNGDDFRRVTFRIAWSDRGRALSMTQTELVVNPSGGLGPRIKSLSPLTQTITLSSATAAAVTFTTSPAAAVHWHADDGKSAGDAVLSLTAALTWSLDWPLGLSGSGSEVLDGTYQLIAQAYDDRGIAGDAKLASVVLNRRAPYAPPSLAGGHDTRLGSPGWVDLTWGLNAERDIAGYRVYWAGPDLLPGNGNDTLVCPASGGAAMLSSTTSSCSDPAPHGTLATAYYVVAVDRDSAGTVREGDFRVAVIGAVALTRPAAPGGPLTAATVDGAPTVTWTAAAGAPIFYRIYRGGTTRADRYDRTTGTATAWSDSRGTSAAHQYWITAVDSTYNESDVIGPVTWSP